ncbi:uncharacterized protein [Diadema setosum]|uniref:uncharacterized protein n=1 Tax=Diadema setosum TaxID=31175 RepID=UPI003B3A057E
MISTTMCCQWIFLSLSAILFLPAIHLASAGLARHRGAHFDRRPHHIPSSSSSSSSVAASSSSSLAHGHVGSEDQFVTAENSTPTALSLAEEDDDTAFPDGFKFVALDQDDTPFIIIPNMREVLENKSDLLAILKSAMRNAHRIKRSTTSTRFGSSSRFGTSQPTSPCFFEYQVTVRRSGRCTRFGKFAACLSGDELYPFAVDC